MFRTALFTSSDRQLDTKERRRYELKLSKAPNMRTVIIALLAIFVISSGLTALGAEIKVTDVLSLRACVSGQAIPSGSSSPDVGRTAGPGDTCVVFDGVYNLAGARLFVSVENLTVRSMNGATATIIQGSTGDPLQALVNILVRGVTFGGPAPDQGFTITNNDDTDVADDTDGIGLCVTDQNNNAAANTCNVPAAGAPNYIIVPAGAGVAQENITIQNNRFLNNDEEGVVFFYSNTTAIDTIRILNNTFSQNGGSGLVFGSTVGAIGRRGLDRNVVIDGNTFDVNVQADAANFPATPGTNDCDTQPANIHFCNTGRSSRSGSSTIRSSAPVSLAVLKRTGSPSIRASSRSGIMLIDRNVIHQNTATASSSTMAAAWARTSSSATTPRGPRHHPERPGPGPAARRGQRHLHHQPGDRGPRRPVRQ
jgi:hypothetical protein